MIHVELANSKEVGHYFVTMTGAARRESFALTILPNPEPFLISLMSGLAGYMGLSSFNALFGNPF